ncbi:MAG: 30S ribosome-binding factor RbfA [Acidobacteria bacterium]|nr:30S ribosome-binding factor RbfA [Acidobacteriota bacterium]MBI3657313.1 30S ribosome-binding factor RbfA [Acidobacteriota bacterium]
MATRRAMRLGSQIKEELSLILFQEVRDPRIGLVTVIDVVLTPDLKRSKVYVSITGSPEDRKATLASLERAGKFIRHKLAERLAIRFTPEIVFYLDTSIDYGERIDRLLAEIKSKPESP